MVWIDPIDTTKQRAAIAGLAPPMRQILAGLLPRGGVVEAHEVSDLLKHEGIQRAELARGLAELAKSFARPQVSNFRVGAVCEGESGALYLGANLEFGALSLNQTIHAEQAAIISALPHESGIKAITVTAAPCGHCRQFMTEFDPDEKLTITTSGWTETRAGLLPKAFGPLALGITDSPFAPPRREVSINSGTDRYVRLACEAAARAYAPYSKAPAGAVLVLRDGQSFAGSYCENAAFNPSVGPMQAALIEVAMSGASVRHVVRAILVTPEGAAVDHAAQAELLLAALVPVKLEEYFF